MASSEQDATTQKVTANSRMTQHGSARRIPKLSINFEGVKQHFPCTTNKLTAAKCAVSCMNRPLCDGGTPFCPSSCSTPSYIRQQIAMSRLPIQQQQQQQQRSMSASTRFACRVVIDDVSDWNHQTKQVPIAVSVRGSRQRQRQRVANEVPRYYA